MGEILLGALSQTFLRQVCLAALNLLVVPCRFAAESNALFEELGTLQLIAQAARKCTEFRFKKSTRNRSKPKRYSTTKLEIIRAGNVWH